MEGAHKCVCVCLLSVCVCVCVCVAWWAMHMDAMVLGATLSTSRRTRSQNACKRVPVHWTVEPEMQ